MATRWVGADDCNLGGYRLLMAKASNLGRNLGGNLTAIHVDGPETCKVCRFRKVSPHLSGQLPERATHGPLAE